MTDIKLVDQNPTPNQSPNPNTNLPFGSWIHEIPTYKTRYSQAKPYEHVIIPNFFETSFAEALFQQFPKDSEPDWYEYNSPIERKKAKNRFATHQFLIESLYQDVLVNETFLSFMRELTGIDNLLADEWRHGQGAHIHGNNGILQLHLDYMIHPISKKERRINLLIYLSKNWKDEYNGHLELWNKDCTQCEQKILPQFNQAVIFNTCDISYHGLPRPIQCPPDQFRQSLAIYYVSSPRKNIPKEQIRYKAKFVPLPGEPISDALKKLYEIRAHRLLTQEDIDTYTKA
jgi:hypothetical protein